MCGKIGPSVVCSALSPSASALYSMAAAVRLYGTLYFWCISSEFICCSCVSNSHWYRFTTSSDTLLAKNGMIGGSCSSVYLVGSSVPASRACMGSRLYVPIDPPSTANLWGSIPFFGLVSGVSLLHTLGLGLILGFLRDSSLNTIVSIFTLLKGCLFALYFSLICWSVRL